MRPRKPREDVTINTMAQVGSDPPPPPPPAPDPPRLPPRDPLDPPLLPALSETNSEIEWNYSKLSRKNF